MFLIEIQFFFLNLSLNWVEPALLSF